MNAVMFNSGLTMGRLEARAYQESLDKESSLYQRIGHIFRLPPGIYTCYDFKISTVGEGPLGGFPFGARLVATLASKNSGVRQEGMHLFQNLFGKEPEASEEANMHTLAEFAAKLEGSKSPDKEKFNKMLNHLNNLLETALKKADTVEKYEVADQFKEVKEELAEYKQKFQQLLDELHKAPVDQSSPAYQQVVNNIQAQVKDSKNVVLGTTISGSGNTVQIGDKTQIQNQYNNAAGVKVASQGDHSHFGTVNL